MLTELNKQTIRERLQKVGVDTSKPIKECIFQFIYKINEMLPFISENDKLYHLQITCNLTPKQAYDLLNEYKKLN